jgi:maltooligosyltrehalose trehalohydrolase
MTIEIWAPRARRLELVVGDARRPFQRRDHGAWQVAAPPAGTDYAISIDGGPPRPDPLSAWQPHGVHGASRVVDHAAFAWTDAGFRAAPLATGLIYELHVGTFTPAGTFDGVIARLDDLVALGVSHVELMPVAAFAGRIGWGYDGVALAAVHDPYGGPDGLKRLVDACHRRGLAVLIDVVWNHLGPEGNYLAELGPYFTDRHPTPWGAAVNLDGPGSDEVRGFLRACARRWLCDYHADGLRIDAVHAMVDTSATPFLEELAAWVSELATALGRPLVLIAESDLNDPRLVQRPARGGFGLDAQWSDDLHHAVHAALTGERAGYYADFGRIADVAAALTRGFVYDGRRSEFRGRRHGRPLVDVPGQRLIGYSQDHDQVGNRARGERLAHLAGLDAARVAAALVFMAPHVPMLFQGEEWAATTPFPYFAGFTDPALVQAVRDGRRREFAEAGWTDDVPDPFAPATFASAVLRWDERTAEPHAGMLAWYRALVALRRHHPELTDGRWDAMDVRHDEAAGWIAVTRGALTLLANLGAANHVAPVGAARLALGSRPDLRVIDGRLCLRPATCAFVTSAP